MSEPTDDPVADEVPRTADAALTGMTDSLRELAESSRGLATEIEATRSDSRWTKYLAIVITAGVLLLGLNAWQGVHARHKIIDKADTQTQTLNEVKHAVSLIEGALSPETQAASAKAGGIVVECAALHAFAQLAHVADPRKTITFPATDDCPQIVVKPNP